MKVGLIRPVTLWPFPANVFAKHAGRVKFMLDVEMNMGQMIEDVKLAVNGKCPVEFFGRTGGIIPTPEEIVQRLCESEGCLHGKSF
jgi:2-oxoglutarate ferredoxin oxidoreductase subunit alpha